MVAVHSTTFKLDWSAKLMLAAVLSSIFLAAMDQTVVSTALPTIAKDLNGLAELPWIVTAYLLTSTVCLPVYGKLGDIIGRKYLLQIAVILFLIGSALSGLAQNMGQLIAFRALQGIGGGGLLVTAIASISDFIPVTHRSKYQGLVGAVFGVATLIGPLLGGFLVDNLSWRWIFYINIPAGLFAIAVVGMAFPKPVRETRWIKDTGGTITLITGLSALVIFASVAGSVLHWNSWLLWAILGLGVTCFTLFFVLEKRHPQPLLPLDFFKLRTFTLSVILSFFVGLAMLGSVSFLPVYLQDVRGFSPTDSGLEMLFLLTGMLVMSIVSGRRISHTQSYRKFLIIGAMLITVAMAWLSTIGIRSPMWHIDGALVLLGLGLGMTTQVLVLSAQLAIPHKNLGVATSTVSLFRSMGGTLGVAAFGAVFSVFMGQTSTDGVHHAISIVHALHTDFLVAAVFSFVAFFGTWFLEDMHILMKKPDVTHM